MAVIKRCRNFNIMTGLFTILFNPVVVYYVFISFMPFSKPIDNIIFLSTLYVLFVIYWIIAARLKKN